jgi:hypothetical protein
MLVSGCARLTTIEPQGQPNPFEVSVKIDPLTLNPPQTATLSFSVTDTSTGKPVTQFEPVSGALLHAVVISRDMQEFRHSYTQNVVDTSASVFSYFPILSKYYVYALFKPAGKNLQTFKAILTTGDIQGSDPNLVESPSPVETKGWLTFRLLKEDGPITAGRATQFVFNVAERGNPVTALWPYLGAAGQLWLVRSDGNDFAHLEGASEGHVVAASTTGGSDQLPGNTTTGGTGAGGSGAAGTSSGGPSTPEALETATPEPAPTFAPGLNPALATAAAVPTQQLAPVQQTPLSSILSTPEVVPSTRYGPNIAFTHTFPHSGLYKMWLEVSYRGQVVLADYVVRVTQ